MSIHPTLKGVAKGKQHRSVLTRIERIKSLMEKELWSNGNKVFGLPKLKIVKVKFKKVKAAEKAAPEAATATPTSETPSAPAEQETPSPKTSSTKTKDKE